MIELIKSLSLKSRKNVVLVLEIFEKVLSELYDTISRTDPFVIESYNILSSIAKSRNVDVDYATKEIDDRVMQSLAIIYAIKYKPKPPNFKYISKNMRHFPNIVNMLGQRCSMIRLM